MARQYYYLVTGLPEIIMDERKLSISSLKFKEEAFEQLAPEDYELVKKLFYPIDNYNLINKLLGKNKKFDERGNLPETLIEENIKHPDDLYPYMIEFIEAYKNGTPIISELSWENQLNYLFYEYIIQDKNEFIRNWFEFDLNIRNILTALNCRKYHLEITKEIIGDNFVAQMLKKSNASDFGLSKNLSYLEAVFNAFENKNLTDREKSIDNLRWNYIDELNTFNYFTIEAVLGFFLKLKIAERWLKLDKNIGLEMFNKILKDLESNFSFPEEFILTGGSK